jgi:hypothetical protein
VAIVSGAGTGAKSKGENHFILKFSEFPITAFLVLVAGTGLAERAALGSLLLEEAEETV